ncbi:hypothetical protein [Chryseobacterium indoltheticum]|uniref:hypothetical protein n=1 Tax=Chryseobacterium indoltheticum TaxID=254 RepID=UPI0040438D89
MKYNYLLILLFLFNFCFSQSRLTKELQLFKSENFDDVTSARKYLLGLHNKEVISALIEMSKDTSFVELKNTGDLIYPGTKRFYGHGWNVRYDIDWLSARAGWLLEEITFQNFGFLKKEISYNELVEITNDKLILKRNDEAERILTYRKIIADEAEKWWMKNENEWTDYYALSEALKSYNVYRWDLAIHYLRFGDYIFKNLNIENYTKELKPKLIEISNSKNSESASFQAKLLLNDDENYWYSNKKIK